MTPQELRSRRKAMGLSQTALGRHLGVSFNTIARWERGDAPIGQPAMLGLALTALEDQLRAKEPARK